MCGHCSAIAERTLTGRDLSLNCPRQDLTPRILTHSSSFVESGYLTENAELLRKTSI